MLFGTLSLFSMGFFLKKILTDEEYGKFSMLITYITMLNSFGLFGAEQLILRKGKVIDNKVVISDSIRVLTLFALLISSIFIPLFFSYLNLFDNKFQLMIFTFFTIIIMLSFNVFRLIKWFNIAQVVQSFWKIVVFFIISILLYNLFRLDYQMISLLFFSAVSISGVIIFIILLRRVNLFNFNSFDRIQKEDIYLLFYFFISLITISIIGNGDKLLLERYFNFSTLGSYFFLGLIISFPFNFVQGYLGFIYIVDYKESDKPIELTKKKIKTVLLYSLILTILVLIVVYASFRWDFIEKEYIYSNWELILIFICTGILRLIYSVYSSWMGALGSVISIRKANFWSLGATILIVVLLLIVPISILTISIGFMLMWLVRLIIWRKFCLYEN